MRLKLGTQDFDLDPMLGGDTWADLYAYVADQETASTPFYSYNCKSDRASDADGKVNITLEPSVYFSVLKKGKTGPVLDKDASKKNRDGLTGKAGMTTKELVAEVTKAIGPVVIEADVNPVLSKWRKKYSFIVSLFVVHKRFMLRLSGAHSAGYAIVSIPADHALYPNKTGSCLPPHQSDGALIKWSDPMKRSETATGAIEEFDKKLDELHEEETERMRKKAEKKGVKITPRDEKGK